VRLERKIPYDPSFHGTVKKDLDVAVVLKSVDKSQATFVVDVKVTFTVKNTGENMGVLEAKAEIRITDVPIPVDDAGLFKDENATEEFMMLVEGGLGEDVMIPLSMLSRAAKMPGIVPTPIIFPRKEFEPSAAESPNQPPPVDVKTT